MPGHLYGRENGNAQRSGKGLRGTSDSAGKPDNGDFKLVLVKRRTRLEELIVRYNTVSQAQFYIRQMGADFDDYSNEHDTYQLALRQSIAELESLGRLQVVDREHVPNYIFGKHDTVVALGQDGLVANTLKYLQEQPLIGVNPDPGRWDGVLLPFAVGDLRKIMPEVLRGQRGTKRVALAKATLNDGQTLYAVNDLFIGRRTHVSARYRLQVGDEGEQQSSSGIIVSTGMGATGWFKSVLAGAEGISRAAGGYCEGDGSAAFSRGERRMEKFGWDAGHLYFSVREPFPSRSTGASLVFGRIYDGCPLRVESQMPEDGVIFSDGVESDYLAFNSGLRATIGLAEKHGNLII
ncbi:diacylglycerol kinase catalytic domain-containing protein [Paenibacillus sp. CAU 1782]